MYGHWHHWHHWNHWRGMRYGRRGGSRLLWFVFGAGTATWWHNHKDYNGWYQARHCGRDRIPQNAYPAPGTPIPAPTTQENDGPPTPGTMDKWERWGWGSWGRGADKDSDSCGNWGWHRRHGHEHARPEGAWGPPSPMPAASSERTPEKDVVQQATDTITDLSEATLNNLLVTVESLKSKLAEHRAQRDQQEREIQALREAKFKQFEEWQRQQERLLKERRDEPPRRIV